MIFTLTLLLSLTALITNAQQPPSNPSQEPVFNIPVQHCASGGSCTTETYQMVIDADYRGASCSVPQGSSAASCQLYDAAYTSVSSSSSSVTFSTGRYYFLNPSTSQYQLFNLLGQEFQFTVDASQLGCGDVSALYFVGMQASGTTSSRNTAGARYGTGYCDAQCLPSNIVDGYYANNQGGACCVEMDIWEGNKEANAFTTHTCGAYQDCGLSGTPSCSSISPSSTCDSNGCQVNAYKDGQTSFYGPSSSNVIDSMMPVTVITRFFTDNSGTLTSIQRVYVQNNNIIGSPFNISSCSFPLATFGQQLSSGMVLVLSAYTAGASWLDGAGNGPCPSSSEHAGPVTFSNVKYGPIYSTYGSSAASTPATSPTATQAAPTTTQAAPTTTSAPATSPTASGSGSCSQYKVQGLTSSNAWTTGAEWQFQIQNTGSVAPNSVIVAISVPSGDTVSNPGNMASAGNNRFSISSPSSFTASSTESYSFEVDRPANAVNPTPVVTIYSCS